MKIYCVISEKCIFKTGFKTRATFIFQTLLNVADRNVINRANVNPYIDSKCQRFVCSTFYISAWTFQITVLP